MLQLLHQSVFHSAITQWRCRLKTCMKARGRHFEHKQWITVAGWTALLSYTFTAQKTWMTATCTCVHVCHMLIHYVHSCTEYSSQFRLQLSLNVSCVFNLQLLCYNCDKFHSNRFTSVWDILLERGCSISEHSLYGIQTYSPGNSPGLALLADVRHEYWGAPAEVTIQRFSIQICTTETKPNHNPNTNPNPNPKYPTTPLTVAIQVQLSFRIEFPPEHTAYVCGLHLP